MDVKRDLSGGGSFGGAAGDVGPGSSWLNLVERWFSALTTKKLQRSAHQSVTALADNITDWAARWNKDPKPFVWTKTADQILTSIGRYAGAVLQAADPDQ